MCNFHTLRFYCPKPLHRLKNHQSLKRPNWEFRDDVKLLNWRYDENECERKGHELDGHFYMAFIVNETLYRAFIGNLELSGLLQSAQLIPFNIDISIEGYNHVWIEVGKETQRVFIGDYFKNYFTSQNAIDLCNHLWENRNWSNTGITKQKKLEYKHKDR